MSLITKEIDRLKIEENIRKLIYLPNPPKLSIAWGMNHITFAPSKRVRPLLLLESNLIYGTNDDDAYLLAAVVELIHTYSLIHDDLPCMDDDSLRRGVETLHTLYGEGYAVLAGDALLTRGYELLSHYGKYDRFPDILRYIGEKAGYLGMINGQMLDLEGENEQLTLEEIDRINQYKTGALLQLSMILGAINGNAAKEEIYRMEQLGKLFGDLFQIKDDILDITGTTEVIGKQVGSDEKNKKSSVPLLVGLEQANEILQQRKQEAKKIIDQLPKNRDFFEQFLDFLVTREK